MNIICCGSLWMCVATLWLVQRSLALSLLYVAITDKSSTAFYPRYSSVDMDTYQGALLISLKKNVLNLYSLSIMLKFKCLQHTHYEHTWLVWETNLNSSCLFLSFIFVCLPCWLGLQQAWIFHVSHYPLFIFTCQSLFIMFATGLTRWQIIASLIFHWGCHMPFFRYEKVVHCYHN